MLFCALAFHLQTIAPTGATAHHDNGRCPVAQVTGRGGLAALAALMHGGVNVRDVEDPRAVRPQFVVAAAVCAGNADAGVNSLSLCESAPSWLALNCMGVRICLGQLKRYACDYLERVSRGETLEIVRRGRLVAFMVPPFPLLCEPSKGGDHIGAADPPAPDANIPLSQLRKNAAPCFDRVAAGDIIGVLRRGRLVARIVAATSIR